MNQSYNVFTLLVSVLIIPEFGYCKRLKLIHDSKNLSSCVSVIGRLENTTESGEIIISPAFSHLNFYQLMTPSPINYLYINQVDLKILKF